MSDPDKLTIPPPVPAYGEDDEAKSMAKPSTPPPAAPASAAPASAAPALGEPPLASGTTETDVEKNRAEAAARAAAKGA